MAEYQCTIKNPVSVEGVGLHTGQKGTITFHPAEAGHGVKFRRTDKPGNPVIPAHIDYVVDTSRGTAIGIGDLRIYTIEHVMASLTGLGIDNVMIDVDVEEMPIRDGSAKYFVEALQNAGIQPQLQEREYIIITEELRLSDPEKGFELKVEPAGHFMADVKIDYNTQVLNVQTAHLERLEDFAKEIAPCRTFVFLHELEFLLHNNLIKGGDLDNAIVFINRAVSQEELDRLADLFKKPKVKVKPEGILNNLELHFDNEPARHKLLDLIGDLSLVGRRIKGHFTVYKPGHYANTEFSRLIYKHTKH